MPDPAEPIPPWYLIDTPEPELFSIAVVCPMTVVQDNPGAWPVTGDLLSANKFNPTKAIATPDKYGNYLYVSKQISGANVIFIYSKNKTEEERNTPFRTYTRKGSHRWPPIVKFVAIVADYGSPRSFPVYDFSGITPEVGQGFGPTYYDSVGYIPDASEGTRFLIEEFFSATAFDIPNSPVPIATAVSYLLPGGGGQSIPECLHPDIEIPQMFTAQSSLIGGSAVGVGTTIGGQKFPATNFTGWSPYVLSDDPTFTPVGYHRIRTRVFPPPEPRMIIQTSR